MAARILCFTDVLCGYCYLGDARLEQLRADFGAQVRLATHFLPTYGDVRRRLDRSGKSGAEFSAMVRTVLERDEHVQVHPEVFCGVLPSSSVPAHLYLSAVKLLDDDDAFQRLLWAVRVAFFRDGRDISQRRVLDELAAEHDIPCAEVARGIDDGRAFAVLARDAELARQHKVEVTPSLVLDEGRQLLVGDVAYRVIEANVRELARSRPRDCKRTRAIPLRAQVEAGSGDAVHERKP